MSSTQTVWRQHYCVFLAKWQHCCMLHGHKKWFPKILRNFFCVHHECYAHGKTSQHLGNMIMPTMLPQPQCVFILPAPYLCGDNTWKLLWVRIWHFLSISTGSWGDSICLGCQPWRFNTLLSLRLLHCCQCTVLDFCFHHCSSALDWLLYC